MVGIREPRSQDVLRPCARPWQRSGHARGVDIRRHAFLFFLFFSFLFFPVVVEWERGKIQQTQGGAHNLQDSFYARRLKKR